MRSLNLAVARPGGNGQIADSHEGIFDVQEARARRPAR
jgi:hypothetical protein